MDYLAAHWRGAYSLGRSCWVNFVTLRIAVYLALNGLALVEFIPLPVFVSLVAIDVALFGWQAIGVIRAGESHIAARGSLTPVWGSYLLMAWFLFFSGSQWLALLPHTIPKVAEEPYATKMERLRAATYRLTLSGDATALLLNGDIALGSTKAVAGLLGENPAIRSLTLQSTGGNIYEARGIARLVRQHGIDTRVEGECSSACTIVFISGKVRTMAAAAKLGFHQYRLDTKLFVPAVDITAEQERDRALFERQAIARNFLDRIFLRPNSEIWYPDRTELLAAGVLTR